jgi:serine acetyltransferase
VIVKSFATISPGCHISGNVKIGEGAFIGTGASILEKMDVGDWSRVGAGCAVIENVEPNTTVVGVPGRIAKRMLMGWHLK